MRWAAVKWTAMARHGPDPSRRRHQGWMEDSGLGRQGGALHSWRRWCTRPHNASARWRDCHIGCSKHTELATSQGSSIGTTPPLGFLLRLLLRPGPRLRRFRRLPARATVTNTPNTVQHQARHPRSAKPRKNSSLARINPAKRQPATQPLTPRSRVETCKTGQPASRWRDPYSHRQGWTRGVSGYQDERSGAPRGARGARPLPGASRLSQQAHLVDLAPRHEWWATCMQ
jgi:hypothetical protein